MTKKEVIAWVVKNYSIRGIMEEIVKGTLIWARLLIKHNVTIGELLSAQGESHAH